MNQQDDATHLAKLLKEQRKMRLALAETRDPARRERLAIIVKETGDKCFELVDQYFRETLGPVLAKRFPGKVSLPHADGPRRPVAMFQYTELVDDFFVQVLSNFKDPFWKKDATIELRDHASIVISNDIRDALRRLKKQEPSTDEHVRTTFEDQLAAEVEENFCREGLDLNLTQVMDVLHQWQQGNDEQLKTMALLMYRRYITDPFEPDPNLPETEGPKARERHMEYIASELRISPATAYRYHNKAIALLHEILCP